MEKQTSEMKHIAFIGIGTNIGAREENLKKSLRLLEEEHKVQIKKVSSVYETSPVGYLEQAAFLNLVAEVETKLEPIQLLEHTAAIENEMGRERLIHWGPRIIDLDILLCFQGALAEKNMEHIHTERLTVPHPRILERAFVMAPLAELEPELELGGSLLTDHLSRIKDQEIKIWSKTL